MTRVLPFVSLSVTTILATSLSLCSVSQAETKVLNVPFNLAEVSGQTAPQRAGPPAPDQAARDAVASLNRAIKAAAHTLDDGRGECACRSQNVPASLKPKSHIEADARQSITNLADSQNQAVGFIGAARARWRAHGVYIVNGNGTGEISSPRMGPDRKMLGASLRLNHLLSPQQASDSRAELRAYGGYQRLNAFPGSTPVVNNKSATFGMSWIYHYRPDPGL